MVFLPINDSNKRVWIRYHYVTLALIAACAAMYLFQQSGGEEGFQRMVLGLGVIPAVLFGTRELDPALVLLPPVATLATNLFLHGGFMHLFSNMLFLWVFGDNIEDSMGHGRFIAFFVACGATASLAHAMTMPGSVAPLIGASGAISGILGAYFVLHPKVKIWVLLFAWIPVRLPTFIILGLWAVMQFFNTFNADPATDNVAWWAHIAGFAAGAGLIRYFKYPHVPLFDTSPETSMDVSGVRLRGRERWGGKP
jgi:membrane associated rhomboid family serine protease